MNRDPFFSQIIERLQGRLDPNLFESCAADLLRTAYPTLVPIRGGDDAGMDGAIADAEGEPFPLVTTTGKDVVGNLTRNLKSYLDRGGTQRKVVLATSQHLSQRRRENLFDRATDLGFTLINIHDQDAVAYLLYRSPEWCQELLNLAGDPSPLSVVPRTTRPQLTDTVIGRNEDLDWLRSSDGDCLLVGQPGSGKTTLLRKLVADGEALFVISRDRGEIAAALRRQEDKITLIIDDAHLYNDIIPDLVQLRMETGAKFSILASCWPSFEPRIADALNLSEQRINRLDLLTRDEMVTVIKSVGVQGPNGMIREIVNQAQGRPGLAVTLTFLCLQGGVTDLFSGTALHRMLVSVLEDLALRPRARLILASLSVGGDAGMSINDIADFLRLSTVDVWETVTQLDESGIVYEFSQGYVSVQPPALRHVLLRDVFFGSGSPGIENLLPRVPKLSGTAMTLLGVKARGGQIPEHLLLDVLRLADSYAAWQEYAWMGQREAKWVFSNLLERVQTMAWPLLTHIPEMVIPELLQRAIGDHRPLNAHPDHALRLLGDWIKAARPHTGQALFRRQVLLKAIRTWLQDGKDIDIGLKALEWTLFPGFEFSSTDPGAGNTVTMHFGSLPTDELLVVAGLWEEVLAIISEVRIEHWEPIRRLIENWVYPSRATVGRAMPEEIYELMREQAAEMLEDIIPLVNDRPGLMQWAARIAEHLNLEIEIPVDEEFQILYPGREPEDWRAAQERQAAAVRELAAKWSQKNPATIVKRIAFIETEAQKLDSHYPRWTPYLCTQIAQQAESVIPWLQALMKAELTTDLVAPFLSMAAQSEQPDWQEYAFACLDRQNYKLATIALTLRLQDPPQELFKHVFEQLPDYSQTVETMCLRNEVPEATLGQLLQHESPAVAEAAAKGEWHADPQGEIRESLYETWQNVVVNQAAEGYWLKQVFQRDPALAYRWLETQLARADFMFFRQDESIKAAIDSLDAAARKQLLNLVSSNRFKSNELVAHIVGDDLGVFEALLSSERLVDLHLIPLLGYPEGTWIQKALLALNAGYSAEEVAGAVHGMTFSWWGSEAAMWGEWVEKFEVLCSHEDERIQTVGVIGRDQARARQDNALQRERNEAVFGRR